MWCRHGVGVGVCWAAGCVAMHMGVVRATLGVAAHVACEPHVQRLCQWQWYACLERCLQEYAAGVLTLQCTSHACAVLSCACAAVLLFI